jgi:hypothetical protein
VLKLLVGDTPSRGANLKLLLAQPNCIGRQAAELPFFLCSKRGASGDRDLLDVPARRLEGKLASLRVALGKRFDILGSLALAARMIRRPTIMVGMGRHGVLAAPDNRKPP